MIGLLAMIAAIVSGAGSSAARRMAMNEARNRMGLGAGEPPRGLAERVAWIRRTYPDEWTDFARMVYPVMGFQPDWFEKLGPGGLRYDPDLPALLPWLARELRRGIDWSQYPWRCLDQLEDIVGILESDIMNEGIVESWDDVLDEAANQRDRLDSSQSLDQAAADFEDLGVCLQVEGPFSNPHAFIVTTDPRAFPAPAQEFWLKVEMTDRSATSNQKIPFVLTGGRKGEPAAYRFEKTLKDFGDNNERDWSLGTGVAFYEAFVSPKNGAGLIEDFGKVLRFWGSCIDHGFSLSWILSWYRAQNPKPDIFQIPFVKAAEEGCHWHIDRLRLDFEREKKAGGRPVEVDADDLVELEWPDGAMIVHIRAQGSLEEEGSSMRHCVGSYWQDVASGRNLIYSYRDPEGVPQATLAVLPDERHSLVDLEGPGNGDIRDDLAGRRMAYFIVVRLRGASSHWTRADLDAWLTPLEANKIYHSFELNESLLTLDHEAMEAYLGKALP